MAHRLLVWPTLVMAAVIPACGRGKLGGPKRDVVLALLNQEAQSLKQDGERVNPEFGVKSTWNIESVEVREQPNDPDRPWAGTIRFKIVSQMKEVDGSTLSDVTEKRFDYVYTTTLNKWIIQYTPPTPRPPAP
jgi:hypothetical protein